MEAFKRSTRLAFVSLGFVLFAIMASVQAEDFACNDEQLLRDSVLNWMPVDDSGEIVNPGCTVLPADYEPTIVRVIDKAATADCVDNYCEVVIEEAVHNGQLYYIARNWSSQTDADAIEDMALIDAPLVPIAIPCDEFTCALQEPIATANQ